MAASTKHGASDARDRISAVRDYHRRTKHLPGRYAPGPGYLDWANQPNPFRRYVGARLVELPLACTDPTPPYNDLVCPGAVSPQPLTAETLGLFLELSLGLSAWKAYEGTRWALRVNPSSGNLHPTEGYIVVPSLEGVSAYPGVYHYAPLEHALEERCVLSEDVHGTMTQDLPRGGFLLGLASVHWREAWKYGARAYRYCQHDAGHALGALRFAAAALGWHLRVMPELSDADVALLLGLDRAGDFTDTEFEAPDLLATVTPDFAMRPPSTLDVTALAAVRQARWRGHANKLSPEHVHWPEVTMVEEAAVKPRTTPPAVACRSQANPRAPAGAMPSAATLIRRRRSAVAMDEQTGMPRDVFLGILARAMPDATTVPWDAFPYPPRIMLCLFVHRVDSLPAGVYALLRDATRKEAIVAAWRPDFAWAPVADSGLPLFALRDGDGREAAAYISCGQAIAGAGAFSLGMVADFSRTLAEEGAWAYRRLFWEAGLIGQVLYLETEAVGLRATGIGCYFDDLMHGLLGLEPDDDTWQSLYHFTVGGAVDDDRLQTLPAYEHLGARATGRGGSRESG